MSRRRREPSSDQPPEETSDPDSAVRAILLRRLSSAPRTRNELREDLRRRGADPDASERVLDRFEEVGLVDDVAFTRLWVESRHRSKALARPVLRRELQQRGVDADTIEQALEDIDDEGEFLRAVSFAEGKARLRSGEELPAAVNRLAGQLARKGYSSSVCFSVARNVLATKFEQRQDDIVDEMFTGDVVDDLAAHQESM
ncbi:MAG: recombination regulator RecX [Candidatus Nanopelagicales bacterium]|nr:recombination regulator RecX [Candidatus Nanopelagicales bacterium]MCH1404183.1 recombination regulator RecX [Candidatus Nanopelagicales bacterium]MCH1462308.1 recombination regulator RecX [Candidatus Nanopelagicales bacterium]